MSVDSKVKSFVDCVRANKKQDNSFPHAHGTLSCLVIRRLPGSLFMGGCTLP